MNPFGNSQSFSQAGVSRSATIVLAYLMTIGDYDLEKALQIVKGSRGYIHPNPGFMMQLRKYYSNDVKKVILHIRTSMKINGLTFFSPS